MTTTILTQDRAEHILNFFNARTAQHEELFGARVASSKVARFRAEKAAADRAARDVYEVFGVTLGEVVEARLIAR